MGKTISRFALVAVLGLVGCATTAETLATSQPRFSYQSSKSPDDLADCIRNAAANTRELGPIMMEVPPLVRDGSSIRLHFDRNSNIFARITPDGEGSHLDYYYDTFMGLARKGRYDALIRSCR